MRGVVAGFPPQAGGTVPLRSATPLSCVPLDGSEPDAKVETLSMERTLHMGLETDQGAITGTAVLPSCL